MTVADLGILGTIERVDQGYRVKETATHWIEVHRMIFNWRIVRIPKDDPWSLDRGWCYEGTGPASLLAAVLAALAWDGADDTEPDGWIKNPFTGERRGGGDPR